MYFISFIYRIENNDNTYYGKYVADYLSDDHDGLDKTVYYYLIKSLNKYRKSKNLPENRRKITIGILSLTSCDFVPFSIDREIRCFDFYCVDGRNGIRSYINGIQL